MKKTGSSSSKRIISFEKRREVLGLRGKEAGALTQIVGVRQDSLNVERKNGGTQSSTKDKEV